MPFDDSAIGKAREGMHVEQRPAAAVGDRQIEGLRHMGDLDLFGEPAAMKAVRLQQSRPTG